MLIATSISALLILIYIYYNYNRDIRDTKNVNLPISPVPDTVLPNVWCDGGLYCDGTLIPQSEAGVGALVCGTNGQQYSCILDAKYNPTWRNLHKVCEPGMKNGCQT